MQVLRLAAVEAKVGLKHAAIYKAINNQERFPKPIPLGPRAVGWLEHEVDEWLKQKAAKRSAE